VTKSQSAGWNCSTKGSEEKHIGLSYFYRKSEAIFSETKQRYEDDSCIMIDPKEQNVGCKLDSCGTGLGTVTVNRVIKLQEAQKRLNLFGTPS
jgi:hypothetical protein